MLFCFNFSVALASIWLRLRPGSSRSRAAIDIKGARIFHRSMEGDSITRFQSSGTVRFYFCSGFMEFVRASFRIPKIWFRLLCYCSGFVCWTWVVSLVELGRDMALIRRVSSSFPRVVGFGNRALYSLNSPCESLDSPTSSSFVHGIHVFHCPVSSAVAVIFITFLVRLLIELDCFNNSMLCSYMLWYFQVGI